MADLTQTINEYLNVSGADETNKWGTLVWGTNKWGSEQDIIVHVGKLIAEALSNTDATFKDVAKTLGEALSLSDSITKDFIGPTIAESLTLNSIQDGLVLTDSAGFYHVFRGNTTEGEDKIISDYTEVSASGTSWTAASEASTSWS